MQTRDALILKKTQKDFPKEGSKQMISRKEASVTVPHTVNPIGFGVGGGMSNDATIPTDSNTMGKLNCNALKCRFGV